jgi:protein SCO1/2
MNRRRWTLAAVACLLALAAGCNRTPNSVDSSAKLWPMHGLILGKSALNRQIVVQQGAIRNFMPAMNAVYTIPTVDAFRQLQPGDQISAKVLAGPDGQNNQLREISVTAQPAHPMSPAMLPTHELLMGEEVPDIPMTNQDGKPVHFPQFHGKAVLITFIDTRCTDDCPIITGLFQKVDMLLRKNPRAYNGSRLITISIDPANDTPPVLRAYGLKYLDGKASGFSHWEFTDMTPDNLKKLATAFGVIYRPSKDDIVHTMATALIGPDNTVLKIWGGDTWKPAVVAKAVADAEPGSGI